MPVDDWGYYMYGDTGRWGGGGGGGTQGVGEFVVVNDGLPGTVMHTPQQPLAFRHPHPSFIWLCHDLDLVRRHTP